MPNYFKLPKRNAYNEDQLDTYTTMGLELLDKPSDTDLHYKFKKPDALELHSTDFKSWKELHNGNGCIAHIFDKKTILEQAAFIKFCKG